MTVKYVIPYSRFKTEVEEALAAHAASKDDDFSEADYKGFSPEVQKALKDEPQEINEVNYKKVVGVITQKFSHAYKERQSGSDAMPWCDWLNDIEFDEKSAKKKFLRVTDSAHRNSKKGGGDLVWAIGFHYRLHAHLENLTDYAHELDNFLFKALYEERGQTVFIEVSDPVVPSAPFSHPQYDLYDDIQDELRNTPKDGMWLDPHNHHSIPLSGRKKEKALLTKLMGDPAPFLVLPLIGPSGAGKTRLVSEWMKSYVPGFGQTNWDAGFVDSTKSNSRDPEPWKDWEITCDTLIVIDYTFAYDAVARQIAERARDNPTRYKIRLLVIDHVFPKFLEQDEFWRNLFGNASRLNLMKNKVLLDPIILKGEVYGSELLCDVIAASASLGGRKYTSNHPKIVSAADVLFHIGDRSDGVDHGNPDAVRHPLFAALMGQAIREAVGGDIDFTKWSRRDLITYYFSNPDRIPWECQEKKKRRKDKGIAVGALVCSATLRRGLFIDHTLRKRLPGKPKEIIAWAGRIVSLDDKNYIKPFFPDILGEAFLLLYLQFIEHEDNKIYDDFIAVLSAASDDKEAHEIASNFEETIARLARNLANDDQAIPSVEDGWAALCTLLNPERFKPETPIRLAVSYAIAEAIERIAMVQKRADVMADRATMQMLEDACRLLARQFWVSDMERTTEGSGFKEATKAFFQYFEFATDQSIAFLDDALAKIATNFVLQHEKKWTATMLAAYWGKARVLEAVGRLLNENIDATTQDGWTALMLASQDGHLDVVHHLIHQPGINLHQRNEDGRTVLDHAEKNNHVEVAELLQRVMNKDGSL